MKTATTIKTLKAVIELLESAEKSFDSIEKIESELSKAKNKSGKLSETELLVNLDTLIRMSSIDKTQWLDFANKNGIPIVHRPKDASRDILDKIMKYLEKNPDKKEQIGKKAKAAYSPELTEALKILLRQ